MTEQKESRPAWPPKNVICVGTIVLHNDRALFVRQAKGHSLAGQWSIPWGVVETGEAPDEAALRETVEEGGITAAIQGLLGYQNFAWKSAVAFVYLCRHVKGKPTTDGGVETDGAAYFSLADLDALAEPVEDWCEWLVRRVLQGDYHLIPMETNNPRQPKTAFF